MATMHISTNAFTPNLVQISPSNMDILTLSEIQYGGAAILDFHDK